MGRHSKELKALEVIKIATTAYESYANNEALQESVKIIEKALKRNVPLKVNHKENKGVTTVGTCGSCWGLVSEVNDNYCSLCGQKTKWEETK